MEALRDTLDRNRTDHPVFFQHYTPGGPLSGFAGLFWYWRGHDTPFSKERILPTGTAELVINLENGRAGISGPRSRSFIIERSAPDQLLGVHFKVGGAFPFLGVPFGDLHGRNVSLADLWGDGIAGQLLSRLHEATTIEKRFRVLEEWLERMADRPLAHHPAVSFAIKEFRKDSGLLSSAAVAEKVNLSQRRFIQLFRDEVGMTPKLFCRVQRFHSVIRNVNRLNTVNWAEVALAHGYFDQSHFIHDFQEFSGLSPTQYLSLRTEYLNHLQVRG